MAALSKYYIPGGKSSGIILLFLIFVVTYFHLSTPPDVTIVHIIHYYALYLLVIFVAIEVRLSWWAVFFASHYFAVMPQIFI